MKLQPLNLISLIFASLGSFALFLVISQLPHSDGLESDFVAKFLHLPALNPKQGSELKK